MNRIAKPHRGDCRQPAGHRSRGGLPVRSGLRAGLSAEEQGFKSGQSPWYLRSYG